MGERGMAKFGGFVSPLKGVDAERDKERQVAQNFSESAADYAEKVQLGGLMCEMLNGLIVSKPEKPVDFLIDLLGKSTAPRFAVVAPPGFVIESAIEAVVMQYNVVPITLPPLLEEAKERLF